MKCTAYNKRFGISAGVFSQKHLYEFASLSPVRTAVKPPPTPSRRTLAVIVKSQPHKQHIWFFADTKANAEKTKRAVFCQRLTE